MAEEAKGKQKEYNRVYRQNKRALETAKERENRLKKRLQAWLERTDEMTGKTRKYNKVYSLQRKQSETQEVLLRRQEKRKQVLASEMPEVRAKRLEQLRENSETVMENETEQNKQSRLAVNRQRARKSAVLIVSQVKMTMWGKE